MTPKTYTARIAAHAPGAGALAVTLDQGGESYSARVFVDNPAADADTPADADHGYVGAIHVYGEGQGGARLTRRVMPMPPMPSARDLHVTIVPVPVGGWDDPDRAVIASVELVYT